MRTLTLLAAALLSGCASLDGPFDGTWLFEMDPNVAYSGDCEPDEDATITEYFGTQGSFVDIYSTPSNELVVMIAEPLRGTAAGSDMEASWEYGFQSDDYEEQESYDLSASLVANILEGSIEYLYITDNDGDVYECATEADFTAERIISHPDSYAGN